MEALMNVVEREPVVIGTSALDTGLMPALPSPALLPVKDTKKLAAEKLEGEKKDANDIYFADPVIGYLLGRIPDDEGLAEDVMQEHKTWKKCLDYIYEQARKMKKDGKCVAVRDDTVYEWAEDYYHRDDKDEEEKKAEEEERKRRREEAAKKNKEARAARKHKTQAQADTAKPEQAQDTATAQDVPKKADEFCQMSLFDFI